MNYTDTLPAENVTEDTLPISGNNGELNLATLVGLDSQGRPLVTYKGMVGEDVVAMTTVVLHASHVGRQLVIMFLNQDISQPVVIGLMKSQLDDLLDTLDAGEEEMSSEAESSFDSDDSQDVVVDGKTINIEGKEKIVLKCGESSITLTKSGKILIRGKYLLNRSSGVNRIMGGSVQVN